VPENGLCPNVQTPGTVTPEEESHSLWGLLEDKTSESPASACEERARGAVDLWQSLQMRLDISRRRPRRLAVYEVAHLGVGSDQEYYVLKNPAAHTYVRCTPQDFFLWERMDGQHTMRDMAVAYFAEFGAFPFERLIGLIAQLGEAGFLEKKPVRIFDVIGQRFEGRSWMQRLNRWANVLIHSQFRLRNADAFFDVLYRRGGWILFSKVAWALYIPLTLIGLILFLEMFYAGAYPLLKAGGSYGLGVLLLVITSFLVVPLHECAHGLTCKHYGREVVGAGAMLYYGSPVFFVDTSDTWLAPKGARIAVSGAGPFSTILIASSCSTVAALFYASPISPYLFKVAFICYLSGLMNLNPLLEWDGYFMLMDCLEIPRLRQKALDFVRRELPKRLIRKRATLSREEVVFAVFGLLSALWTAIALVSGLRFVQRYLVVMLQELQEMQDPLSVVVVGLILLIYGLPLMGGLALKVAIGLAAGTKKLLHRVSAT
jgi:putative peptide zinc metalloprotease protein